MPFKFVDDGYPEADDYASNYEWVEPVTTSRPVERPRPSAMQVLRALTWGKCSWSTRKRPQRDATGRRAAR